jgi:tetratricopeptide (TPR) repeat protein
MNVELLVRAVVALALGAAGDERTVQDELRDKDRLLTQLLELQQRVRSGQTLTPDELSVARTTREQILAGLDVRRAVRLGMEPKAVRDRLQPGFHSELELLDRQRARREHGPLAEPSPLLTMVLDLEQDLWREADRRRQRIGIKSPLDSGPLSQRLEAQPATTNDPAAASPDATATAAATMVADPRLRGQAHYRAGRYAEAFAAWKDLAAPAGPAAPEFEYQRANCLFQMGRTAEASAAWQKLADEQPTTSWGAQAQFMLKVARALDAARAAKEQR